MMIQMAPKPCFGSGPIKDRYAPLTPPKPLPWYFDQTKTMFVAVGAIIGWVIAVLALNH